MKKTLKTLFLSVTFAGLVTASAAAEGFSTAGFWKSDSARAGGSMELGFPSIFEAGDFFVRDSLEVGGAGLMTTDPSTGVCMVSDKVSFGGKKTINGIFFKSYGFTYAGANLFFPGAVKEGGKKMDLGFDFGGGGGFEIGIEEGKSGFVIEYGGGYVLVPSKMGSKEQSTASFGYNSLTLGFRQYF